MRSVYIASTSVTYEEISESVLQTWVIQHSVVGVAVRSICGLVLLLRYRNSPLKLNDDYYSNNNNDVENTDDDRTDEYTRLYKRRRSENAEEDDDNFGEQGMIDDDWQHEDGDDTTDQQENTGHGDDGDDDDDDDDDDGGSEDSEDEDDNDDVDEESDDEDKHPLLEHAREVYASDSFRIFEHEYRKTLPLSSEVSSPVDPDDFHDNYVSRWICDSSKDFKVSIQEFPEIIVNCSCNYFSITGILCSHSLESLRIFHLDEEIPDRYLLKWHLKNFTNDQIPKVPSSLETRKCIRSADDCTKVSRGGMKRRYETLDYRNICTDYDYIAAPLLRHAKDIYKPEIYNKFREEYRRSEYLSLHPPVQEEMIEGGSMFAFYKFYTAERTFGLYSELPNGTVDCGCGDFEANGILCSHALLVLYINDVVKIPPQYIVPSHLKEGFCYDAVNDGKFHGPNYADIDRSKRRRLMEMKIRVYVRSKYNVEVDYGFMQECLKQLSLEPGSRKNGCVPTIRSRKAEVKFWDDHEIKSFSYKESVITRRNCDTIGRYLYKRMMRMI